MLKAILVGCGAISDAWLTDLRKASVLANSVQIAGFVDLDLATARARAAKHGYTDALCSDDLTATLAQVKPDIVFDLVVPPARFDVVQKALASGAHVLSEKPMANTLAAETRVALCCFQEPISVQLTKAGLKFNELVIKEFQEQNQAIINFMFSDLLTEREVKKVRERMMKKIIRHLGKFKENRAKVDNA